MKHKTKHRKRSIQTLRMARLLLIAALVAQALVLTAPVLAQDGDGGGESDGGGPGGGGRGGEVVGALRQIAQVVIDIFIGIATILMAVGIVTGFVGGQFMVTVGSPFGLSKAWTQVIAVVILGIGGLLTITIVNTIIDIMAGLVPATVIPSAMPRCLTNHFDTSMTLMTSPEQAREVASTRWIR